MKLKFTKMQAYGNDYVYIDAINQDLSALNLNKLASDLSNRNFYVGADGIVLICTSDVSDFKMRMFNADGSEAEMCGNALRSMSKFVFDYGLTTKTEFQVETLGGLQEIQLFVEAGKAVNILANIGEPGLKSDLVPVHTDKDMFIEEEVEILDRTFKMSSMSWGNPHTVIFLDDIFNFDVHGYGKAIEFATHLFPNKTNVTFAQVENRNYIKIREWERGTGETIGCGTGCCSAVVMAVLTDRCDREVTVEQIGGNLEVKWDEGTNQVFMKGPSYKVFEAEIEVDC